MSATRTAVFLVLAVATALTTPSSAATDTFVYGGCSQQKYTPGSAYESNLNSLLTSLVNSAALTTYNNFTIQGGQQTSTTQDTVYGLYQCRGDLSGTPIDCGRCVARAVSRTGSFCMDACGGAMQLEGCFIKYDNTPFLGVPDKTIMVRRCGSAVGFGDSGELSRRDAALGSLEAGGAYRVGGSGDVQGVAQCTGDLSAAECQDCLGEAIGRLKGDCGAAAWGDVYLAKCYARYMVSGSHSRAARHGSSNNDDEIQKTLSIIIGLIAGVTVLVVFLSCLGRACQKGGK